MGVGRVGCLVAGCCFGRPTDWWWGFTFTNPAARVVSGTPIGVPLHPTQILQMLDGFLLFAILYFVFRRRRFDGQVAALYFILEGLSRFLIEFLRGDPRGAAVGLATSQWIALGMIVAGIGIWAWRSGRGLTPTTRTRLRHESA
jgi:phosphatidylglycerol:prolipoprotein diacylglycerol transferase